MNNRHGKVYQICFEKTSIPEAFLTLLVNFKKTIGKNLHSKPSSDEGQQKVEVS